MKKTFSCHWLVIWPTLFIGNVICSIIYFSRGKTVVVSETLNGKEFFLQKVTQPKYFFEPQ